MEMPVALKMPVAKKMRVEYEVTDHLIPLNQDLVYQLPGDRHPDQFFLYEGLSIT